MARIAIFISSQQKGVFVTLAKLLVEAGHDVVIVADSPEVVSMTAHLLEGLNLTIEIKSQFKEPDVGDRLIAECLEREERYGVPLSFLMSNDRGLGRGYLLNCDRYPQIRRSWWSHERKLALLLRDLQFWEHVMQKYRPTLVLAVCHIKSFITVTRQCGATFLALQTAKYGERYGWIDNEYFHNPRMIEVMRETLASPPDGRAEMPAEYRQVDESAKNHAAMDYSYWKSVKDITWRIWFETKTQIIQRLKGKLNNQRYYYLGWAPYVLRRPRAYRYFLKHGVRPEDVAGNRLVYFPLHLEPEVTLMSVSPEFNNSMEAICWISKALPADALLVVKEQPYSFGLRSKGYYDHLRQIGNVVLADPRVHSWDWIKAASAVAAITGTVGVEAIWFDRPVLSYGKHQVINYLPTVRYVSNYDETLEAIEALFEGFDPALFETAKQALSAGQLASSFEFPGYPLTTKSCDIQPELAGKAYAGLQEHHAACLAVQSND